MISASSRISRISTSTMSKLHNFLRSRRISRSNFHCRCYSGKSHGFAASLVEHESSEELSPKYKPLERLPSKPPFMKNVFQAKFNTDFLAYPEFLPSARLDLLDRNSDVVRELLNQYVDSAKIDRRGALPDELLDKLRNLKLYGLLAPRSLGGAEFTHTERARILEILGNEPSLAVLLFNHETLGHKLISEYGSDQLKSRWLKPLIAGQKYATLCFAETENGSDASQFSAHALRADTDWLLSGTKIWVPNADKADLFIVVAKARLSYEQPRNPYYADDEDDPIIPEDIGFFLVEKNAANVNVGVPVNSVGMRGLSMCEVTFDNVLVPESMVLTDFERGYDVVKRFLTEDRYAIGCVAAAVLRKALNEATGYCLRRKLHGHNLYKYEFAQRRLGKMLINLYAIESLVYMTTGMMDMHRGQDCEVENAITKVFATEMALKTVNDAISLMGGQSLLENSSFQRYQRDLLALSMFDHHNDLYRSTIALNGLQYISNNLNSMIVENRNPLFFSFKNFRNTFNLRFYRAEEDNLDLYLKLKDHLHPSLMYLADQLEYCVLRFEHGIVKTLSTVGPGCVHDQMYLRRIADCAILIYAMTAVLSRASRSYCIGLQHADEEMVLAETFVRDSHDAFKELVAGLQFGECYVTDYNFKKLSAKTVENGGYFVTEPLKLNY